MDAAEDLGEAGGAITSSARSTSSLQSLSLSCPPPFLLFLGVASAFLRLAGMDGAADVPAALLLAALAGRLAGLLLAALRAAVAASPLLPDPGLAGLFADPLPRDGVLLAALLLPAPCPSAGAGSDWGAASMPAGLGDSPDGLAAALPPPDCGAKNLRIS